MISTSVVVSRLRGSAFASSEAEANGLVFEMRVEVGDEFCCGVNLAAFKYFAPGVSLVGPPHQRSTRARALSESNK